MLYLKERELSASRPDGGSALGEHGAVASFRRVVS